MWWSHHFFIGQWDFTSKFVINKFVKRTDIIAINDFLFQMFMMVENTDTGIYGWFIICCFSNNIRARFITMSTAQFFSEQFSYKSRIPFKFTRLVISLFWLVIFNWNEIGNNVINMTIELVPYSSTYWHDANSLIQSICDK